jgi:hypothetical protein
MFAASLLHYELSPVAIARHCIQTHPFFNKLRNKWSDSEHLPTMQALLQKESGVSQFVHELYHLLHVNKPSIVQHIEEVVMVKDVSNIIVEYLCPYFPLPWVIYCENDVTLREELQKEFNTDFYYPNQDEVKCDEKWLYVYSTNKITTHNWVKANVTAFVFSNPKHFLEYEFKPNVLKMNFCLLAPCLSFDFKTLMNVFEGKENDSLQTKDTRKILISTFEHILCDDNSQTRDDQFYNNIFDSKLSTLLGADLLSAQVAASSRFTILEDLRMAPLDQKRVKIRV